METNSGTPCEYLLDCLVGDATEQQRKAFENHLSECSSCHTQWKEMNEVWSGLPDTVEPVEPPAELKEEVMAFVFGRNIPEQTEIVCDTPARPAVRPKIRRSKRNYSVGVAVAAVFMIACFWMYTSQSGDQSLFTTVSAQPLYVEQTYTLRSFDRSAADAQGTGWIVCQGKNKKLVVNVSGLDSTAENEAYQVWLIRNGHRQNAGTFRVDPKGSGVLIYDLPRKNGEFDSIGITREPDSEGSEPRGQKVLGN
ncbi:anti-sigma factor [Paenibacillus ginsengarvi]|uniref:Regulator of SigK n=1 Tax=Paenibacillus ginsengarvi TaxID=400777 RepID=A0A3B0CP21_9BACL|nr:anti-sigma factor [Paenibacillus ginsengarvi]RKN86802.1 anti-sigma factor [Paenibacillus ginsengarvi]